MAKCEATILRHPTMAAALQGDNGFLKVKRDNPDGKWVTFDISPFN